MAEKTAKEVVMNFWDAMQTNDFRYASTLLSKDYEGFWPQSKERIKGRHNFERINTTYPGGPWQFTVHSIVAEGQNIVTDISVTDGTLTARAITFHTVTEGLISRQTEYWPDQFEAPEWRREWVTVES